MRRLRYNVAATLDGYIAGPSGEFDWIPDDPSVDFEALFARVDTVVMGRRTYLVARAQGALPWGAGTRVYIVSSTLDPLAHPGVTIAAGDPVQLAASLRAEQGTGEVWLFGGGALFATLLEAGQVDAVEITIVPLLLGGGVPMLPPTTGRHALALTWSHVYPSGMAALHYDVLEARRDLPDAVAASDDGGVPVADRPAATHD